MTYPHTHIVDMLRETARHAAGSRHSRSRQRQALSDHDDRLPADIGVAHRDSLRGRPDGARPSERTEMAGRPTPQSDPGGRRVLVRDATVADMPAIQAIYQREVLHGLASFEEVPPDSDELSARRQTVLDLGLPYLVAEWQGRVAGYSYATVYRPRPAYRHTVEDSVYVADGMRGLGIGRALLDALISRCEHGPWCQMVAVIGDIGNSGSIILHERLGVRRVGVLKAVGFKLGRWGDPVRMQRT